jgi:hypothetical protein
MSGLAVWASSGDGAITMMRFLPLALLGLMLALTMGRPAAAWMHSTHVSPAIATTDTGGATYTGVWQWYGVLTYSGSSPSCGATTLDLSTSGPCNLILVAGVAQ